MGAIKTAIKPAADLHVKPHNKAKTNLALEARGKAAHSSAAQSRAKPALAAIGLNWAGSFLARLARNCGKPNGNCIIYYLLPLIIIIFLSACGGDGGSSLGSSGGSGSGSGGGGDAPIIDDSQPAPAPIRLSTTDDTDGDGFRNAYDSEYLRADIYIHGNGTDSNPYVITNIYQLQAIAGVDHTGAPLAESDYTNGSWIFGESKQQQLNSSYVLQGEIDAGATAQWNTVLVNGTVAAAGFAPIGECDWSFDCAQGIGDLFRGKFAGKAYEISGLYINRRRMPRVGLFGALAPQAIVGLVSLTAAEIHGASYAGGLAGVNYGRIYNSDTAGDFAGTYSLGALVGENHGLVSSSSGAGRVEGGNSVGGLVGANYGEIEFSYAAANVIGDNVVGGLAGSNSGRVADSYSRSGVTGAANVGGLVGSSYGGAVSDSYSSGLVAGLDRVGGLLGTNNAASFVAFSNSVAFVFAATRGGGLVGDNQGEVFASYAESEVTGADELGGLAGHSNGTITASYSLGRAVGNNTVGGLVGLAAANITSSYSRAEVSGRDNVGGLVGVYRGAAATNAGIYSSYAAANISVAAGGRSGGLVANNTHGVISASYWQSANLSGAPGQAADAGTQVSQEQLQRCRAATEEEDKVLCAELFPAGAWGGELSRGGAKVVWDFSDPSAPPALLVLSRAADKDLPITQCRFAPTAKPSEKGRAQVCNINLARRQLRAGVVFARLAPPSADFKREFVYQLTGIQTDLFYLDKDQLVFARALDEKDARHYEFGARAVLLGGDDAAKAGQTEFAQQIKLTVVDR